MITALAPQKQKLQLRTAYRVGAFYAKLLEEPYRFWKSRRSRFADLPPAARKTRATATAWYKKGRFYKPLAKKFRRDGFVHREVLRQKNAAVYEKRWTGCAEPSVCYETIRVKRREGFWIEDRFVVPSEVYPRSEQWGALGWTFCDKDAAFAKLRDVERK
jgi:hypothetical protein